MFPESSASGTLLIRRLNVPASGAECVLVLAMVKLAETLPATSAVLLVKGSGVVGLYLFKVIIYSYP